MSSSQDAAKGSKNIKRDPKGRRRGSCIMMLIGIALLIIALWLYFYYESNSPVIREESGNISNINRNTSNTGAASPRPTPSPTASP